jgi:hypothetical protein
MAQDLNDWNVLAANNNDTPPDGWPENTMQYSEVNNTAREGMAVTRRFWGDINGSLSTGGIADAYTLTLNATTYAAYFAGMYFACIFSATNTGGSTIDVNGIGTQTILNRDGSALGAGAIQSGGIYELRYDGTNFQLMGSLGGGTTVIGSARLTNSDSIDLVDTNVALVTGAADPDSAQHLEFNSQAIQSKTDATTAGALFLQPVGVLPIIIPNSSAIDLVDINNAVNVGALNPGGDPHLAIGRSEIQAKVGATAVGQLNLNALGGIVSFGGSTSEAMQYNPAAPGLLNLGNIGAKYKISSDSVLGNISNGSTLLFSSTEYFHVAAAGNVRVRADINTATPPISEAVVCALQFYDLAGNDQLGRVGYSGNNVLQLANVMETGELRLLATNTSGASRIGFAILPDSIVEINHPASNAAVLRTVTPASGGVTVDNQASGAGFERVLTTADLGAVNAIAKFLNSDQDNATTTSVDVTELSTSVLVADTDYAFEAYIIFVGAAFATTGIKWDFQLAAGAFAINSYSWVNLDLAGAGSTINADNGSFTGIRSNTSLTDNQQYIMRLLGSVRAGAAGATVDFRFAQQVSDATLVRIVAGSWLRWTPIA